MSRENTDVGTSGQSWLKRRGLLRIGTLATAVTGASALSGIVAGGVQAAPPGEKNPSTSYIPNSEKGTASGVATLDSQSRVFRSQIPDLSAIYAPRVYMGTLASRPVAPSAGTEWVQTDAAEGNPAGTRTYFDGATWSAQLPAQVAQVGCQSNTWFTTMPDPNPPASNITYATPNAGANGVSLSLFRLRKSITIASLVLRKGTGTAPYSQAIYRLDGAVLTRIATTGELGNPNLDNNIRRDPLLSVVTLTAGTTYYYALTSGTGTFQYYQRAGGSIHTVNMIGLVFGEATALYKPGAFHPAPDTIDTLLGTWSGWQNPPVHFGLAYT